MLSMVGIYMVILVETAGMFAGGGISLLARMIAGTVGVTKRSYI
jgi:hypothetical protein